MQQNQPRKTGKTGIINVLIIALVVVLVAFPCVFLFRTAALPHNREGTFLGIRPLILESDSMVPAIEENALVIGQKASFDTLKKDDIICYILPNGKMDSMRVEYVEEDGKSLYVTGDNKEAYSGSVQITEEIYRYKIVQVVNAAAKMSPILMIAFFLVLPGILLCAVILVLIAVVRKIFSPKNSSKAATQTLEVPGAETPPVTISEDDVEELREMIETVSQQKPPPAARPTQRPSDAFAWAREMGSPQPVPEQPPQAPAPAESNDILAALLEEITDAAPATPQAKEVAVSPAAELGPSPAPQPAADAWKQDIFDGVDLSDVDLSDGSLLDDSWLDRLRSPGE